jgi:hypothetical protein
MELNNDSLHMPLNTQDTMSSGEVSQGELTPAQAETMAGWLRADLAAGKLTQDQFNQALRELGQDPAAQPDPPTEEQRQFDEAFGVAGKPSDYTIRWVPPGQEGQEMPAELQQLDTNARTWMSSAGFTRELGNSLVRQIDRVAGETGKMSEAEIEMRGRAEFAKLERAYGDQLEAKLRQAGEMVTLLEEKTPGLRHVLQTRGVGDDALVASLLIGQAERYFARRGR